LTVLLLELASDSSVASWPLVMLADIESGSSSPRATQLFPARLLRMARLKLVLLFSGVRRPDSASPRMSVPVRSSGLMPVRA
jgi:hypothetical protein